MNALRRRKKRIRRRLEKAILENRPSEIQSLDRRLSRVCYEIKEAYDIQRKEDEVRAIKKIKSNPKYFYSYSKSHSIIRSEITMVQSSDGEIHTDSKSIADVLQHHFSSVYSDPCSNDIKFPCPAQYA